jgi:hypothetical protein
MLIHPNDMLVTLKGGSEMQGCSSLKGDGPARRLRCDDS